MAELSLLNNTVDAVGPSGFEVRGFNDLNRHLEALGSEISRVKTARIWNKVLKNAFEPALGATRAAAPVRTGVLKSQIGIASQRAGSRDIVSKYVTPGTTFIARVTSGAKRPLDKLKTKAIKKLNSAGGLIFRTYRSSKPIPFWFEYGTEKFPARFYLRNALASTRAAVISKMETEIAGAITELTAKWGAR